MIPIGVVFMVIPEFRLDSTAPFAELLNSEEKAIQNTKVNEILFDHSHSFIVCSFTDALKSESDTCEHFLLVTVAGQPR